jgi:hypothetical protein
VKNKREATYGSTDFKTMPGMTKEVREGLVATIRSPGSSGFARTEVTDHLTPELVFVMPLFNGQNTDIRAYTMWRRFKATPEYPREPSTKC